MSTITPAKRRRKDLDTPVATPPDTTPNGSMVGPLICVAVPVVLLVLYGIFTT
jgi:hypothetical protein